MEYRRIGEVSEQWQLSVRRIQFLCAAGKIPGAVRFGRDWMIPKGAQKPVDGRSRAARRSAEEPLPLPRKTPFLYMSDLYRHPGTAEESGEALRENHEAELLFRAEIAYSRGEIDRVFDSATYLLARKSGFYAVLAGGMLLALCAIWRGDLSLWRKAKLHIAEAPAKTEMDRDVMLLSIAAVDSMLYDVKDFPDWFKIGCFEPLHADALPAAKVYYAKYLYAAAYAVATGEAKQEGVDGLALMKMLPFTVEPMISQALADQSLIAEIYLRMICCTIYHTAGDEAQATRHLTRAIALALPDRLYGLLAEYCRLLYPLMERHLGGPHPEAWERVKSLYKTYNEGWTALSGSVRGKNLATTLSQKEREVAKLAAFGMSNPQIAEKLHMSLSGVKQAVRIVCEKTGVSRDEFAAVL